MTTEERLERHEPDMKASKRRNRWVTGSGVMLILGCLSIATYIHAAESSKERFSVTVSVSADEDIKELVTSYVNRELRALNDVELVDDESGWVMSIVAVKTGKSVAVSSVTFEFETLGYLKRFLSEEGKECAEPTFSHQFVSERPAHALRTDSIDNLQNICKKIVAVFDSTELDRKRNLKRMINKMIESSKNKEQKIGTGTP